MVYFTKRLAQFCRKNQNKFDFGHETAGIPQGVSQPVVSVPLVVRGKL